MLGNHPIGSTALLGAENGAVQPLETQQVVLPPQAALTKGSATTTSNPSLTLADKPSYATSAGHTPTTPVVDPPVDLTELLPRLGLRLPVGL